MNDQLKRIQASLLGVRIGDALGQPVETMTRQEIVDAEVDGKRKGTPVDTFFDSIQRNVDQTSVLKAGDTTDDTQLTDVVAESYIACSGFDLEDMVDRHIAAYNETVMGWGGATKSACKNLKLWKQTFGKEGRNPSLPLAPIPLGKEAGNGVAIKIIPVGLFHGLHDFNAEVIYQDVKRIAELSHPHPESLFAAYALALLAASVIQRPIESDQEAKGRLAYIIDEVRDRESILNIEYVRPSVCEMLKKLDELLGDPERIFQEISPNFTAGQSVIYSIGIFLTYRNDFKKAVLRAVNDGLDADSTASMVGGLAGANGGLENIPRQWQSFSPKYASALNLGRRLYEAAVA